MASDGRGQDDHGFRNFPDVRRARCAYRAIIGELIGVDEHGGLAIDARLRVHHALRLQARVVGIVVPAAGSRTPLKTAAAMRRLKSR